MEYHVILFTQHSYLILLLKKTIFILSFDHHRRHSDETAAGRFAKLSINLTQVMWVGIMFTIVNLFIITSLIYIIKRAVRLSVRLSHPSVIR